MRFSPRLYKSRHHVYYFRFLVPLWLRHVLGKTEIRKSLGTHDPREALRLAANLSADIEELVKTMGNGKPNPAFKDIRHLILRDGDKVVEIKDLKSDPTNPAEQRLIDALTDRINEFGGESRKSAPRDKGPTLNEVIDGYCADQNGKKEWTPKTGEEVRTSLAVFAQIIGEATSFAAINREDIRRYRELLAALPPNLSKKPEFKGLSLAAIAEGNTGQRISVTTLKKHMQRVNSLFIWGVREGRADKNPAEGLAPKAGARSSDERSAFSEADLHQIFSQPTLIKGSKETSANPFKYWVPWIGLYSGMRIEEICQLHIDDIKQTKSGTWYFDINESGHDKRIKTGRNRETPVHSKLIALGLVTRACRLCRNA